MPRNGSGAYSLPNNSWFPAANGNPATPDDWNDTASDIAAAISQSVSSDGQTPMVGNLPMGNNKITGLADGEIATDAAAYGQINVNAGQCRLVKSGANLVLTPYQGNRLAINGALYTIPSSGVSLAATGTTAGTLYYIYAYMNAGTMMLEYSTTGHETSVITGIETKISDPTRTLVGMARPTTGPEWVDTSTKRFVLSWFNQKPLTLQGIGVADYALPTGSLTAVNVAFDCEYLTWGTNGVIASFTGSIISGLGASSTYLAMAVDNTFQVPLIESVDPSSNVRQAAAVSQYVTLSEGYHFHTMFGQTTGTTAYIRQQSVLNVTIQG